MGTNLHNFEEKYNHQEYWKGKGKGSEGVLNESGTTFVNIDVNLWLCSNIRSVPSLFFNGEYGNLHFWRVICHLLILWIYSSLKWWVLLYIKPNCRVFNLPKTQGIILVVKTGYSRVATEEEEEQRCFADGHTQKVAFKEIWLSQDHVHFLQREFIWRVIR